MDINEYEVTPNGILIHNNFKSKLDYNLPAGYMKEELWENFKLLVKIANEENNSGE